VATLANNTENLVSLADRTKDEQREIARKGGIASGESRRRRKTLKEELITLLEQGDTQERVSLALLQQVLDGNVQAFNTLRDTIGEKPVDKVEANVGLTYEEQLKKVSDNDEY
jgi:hypothetical protein